MANNGLGRDGFAEARNIANPTLFGLGRAIDRDWRLRALFGGFGDWAQETGVGNKTSLMQNVLGGLDVPLPGAKIAGTAAGTLGALGLLMARRVDFDALGVLSRVLRKQRGAAGDWRPAFMHRRSGEIIHSDTTHFSLYPIVQEKNWRLSEIEDGFIDKGGKFHNRAEALAQVAKEVDPDELKKATRLDFELGGEGLSSQALKELKKQENVVEFPADRLRPRSAAPQSAEEDLYWATENATRLLPKMPKNANVKEYIRSAMVDATDMERQVYRAILESPDAMENLRFLTKIRADNPRRATPRGIDFSDRWGKSMARLHAKLRAEMGLE